MSKDKTIGKNLYDDLCQYFADQDPPPWEDLDAEWQRRYETTENSVWNEAVEAAEKEASRIFSDLHNAAAKAEANSALQIKLYERGQGALSVEGAIEDLKRVPGSSDTKDAAE